MRRKIVAGNWKMNKTLEEAGHLIDAITGLVTDEEPLLVIAPPFPFLHEAVEKTKANQHLSVSGQNCASHSSGAYTGEVSAAMLKSVGCEFVILGHSERRAYYNESDEVVKEKVDQALESKLQPIFCCGESLEQRKEGDYLNLIADQIKNALFHLDSSQFNRVVLAYEPVWAIGTGETASPDQAQEVHQHIRKIISDKYGPAIAENTSILYGGSCKPGNAADLFRQADVDGGLIGGASLDANDFVAIAKSF